VCGIRRFRRPNKMDVPRISIVTDCLPDTPARFYVPIAGAEVVNACGFPPRPFAGAYSLLGWRSAQGGM
jgi:hypothetical protein